MYFALISIGITASVNIFYSFFTTTILIFLIISIYIYDKYQVTKGNKIHNLSFDEGNYLYTIEIESKEKIENLEKNKMLINKIHFKENNLYFYRLSSSNKDEIEEIQSNLENNTNVLKLDISY
tara:strand:+ start:1677 stop:2045 length:369 start_codon:yes stop_codon:yes gene_type:complete